MARLHSLLLTLLLAITFVQYALCVDPLEVSPSPAPLPGADSISPSPDDAGAPVSPSPFPDFSSPPAPPPLDLASGSSPTPSPAPSPSVTSSSSSKKAPAPAPTVASDISHENDVYAGAEESKEADGLKGGQKAGIAIGVIAGVCIVGLGGIVYKKRQQNIQRSQYGYAARRELL